MVERRQIEKKIKGRQTERKVKWKTDREEG